MSPWLVRFQLEEEAYSIQEVSFRFRVEVVTEFFSKICTVSIYGGNLIVSLPRRSPLPTQASETTRHIMATSTCLSEFESGTVDSRIDNSLSHEYGPNRVDSSISMTRG